MFERFELMTRIMLIAHWCFSWCWALLTQCQGHFSLCPDSVELAVHNNLGEDTTRAADPSRQRDAPYHMAPCLSLQLGELAGRVATAQGPARHWSAGGKKLYYALFVSYILFCFLFFSFLFYSNPHYLNPWVLPFFDSVPCPSVEWANNIVLLRCLPRLTTASSFVFHRLFFKSDTTSTDIICHALAADSLSHTCISQLRYTSFLFSSKFCPTIHKNVFIGD